MMKKRLSKTLWYGSDIDKEGKPVLPPLVEEANDLEGIHEGELYLHLGDGSALLFTRSADGQVVQLGRNADELANYLLKSVWDKAFEIRATENGEEYLFTKLNLATQYGITMYANGGLLDLPSIFEGIPVDNDTIYWEETKDEEGNVITRVLKSRGVGEGGVTPTLLGDLTNVGEWANAIATEDRIMVQKKDSSSWVALELSKIGGGSADFSNVLFLGNGNAFTSFSLSDDKKTLTFIKGQTFALQTELDKKWTTDNVKIANWNTAYGWGDHSKANYATKSSTLSGYGITNAYTKTEINNLLGDKADWGTTLSDYGITDAYTSIEVDSLLEKYLPIVGGTITGNLRLRRGTEYTSPYLYFGDGSEVWLKEESDTYLTIHANGGVNIDSPATFIDGIKIEKSADGVLYIDADIVVKGGVTMFANEGEYTPSTITQAVNVDGITIINDGTKLMLNPNLEFGGGLDETALGDYLLQNQYAKKSDIDTRINNLVNGAPAAYDTLKEIADVLDKNVDSVGDIITALGNKADKATTLSGYGITDAYTKTNVDSLLSAKWTKDGTKISNWDTAYSWGNHAQAGYFKSADFTKDKIKTTLGISDWALTSTKPSYTTKEVAEDTNLYFTNARAVSALSDTLKGYVTLSGAQTISGEKNFTGGLKVNGSPIVYNAAGKYWKLEGDLLVTGGVTMFGNDSSFSPSTITQAVNVDGTTIINDGKKLMLNPDIQLGGGSDIDLSEYAKKATTLAGYGITDAYTKTDADNKYLLKASYTASDVLAKLKTVDGANSGLDADLLDGQEGSYYASNASLDNYLPLSGGTMTGSIVLPVGSSNTPSIKWGEASRMGADSSGNFFIISSGAMAVATGYTGTGSSTSIHIAATGAVGIAKNLLVGHAGYLIDDKYSLAVYGDSWYEKSLLVGKDIIPQITNKTNVGTSDYRLANVFTTKANVDGIEIKKSADGVLYIGGNLVVSGGITMYGTDGTTAPLIWDDAPIANTIGKKGVASYDPSFFAVNDGVVTFVGQTGGGGVTDYNDLDNLPDLTIYALKTSLSSYQTKITSTNKLGYGLISGTPTSLKNPNALTFGSKSYDGSAATSITASDLGALTSHQTIYNLTFSAGSFSKKTFDPNGGSETVNIPTTTSHISEGSNLYFTNARAVSALSDTLSNYLPLSGGTINGALTIKPINIAGVQDGIILHDGGYGSGESLKIKWISESYKTGLSLCVQQNNESLLFENSDGFNTVWHSGNVGSGSGLDADKLDGQEGSYYASVTSLSSYLPLIGGTMTGKITLPTGNINSEYSLDWGGKAQIGANSGGNLGILTNAAFFVNTGRSTSGSTAGFQVNGSGNSYITGSLKLGGSTFSTSYKLYVVGTGYLTSDLLVGGGVTMYSDVRKKTILNHVELSLKEVAGAPLIEHYYNSDEKKTTHVGSVAQYWAGLNDWFCKEDEEGYLMMEIQNAALASAISVARELTRYESKTDKQIKKLKKRIGELEEEIENLKKM